MWESALKRHFGYDRFRAGQEDAVRAVMEGRDAVVVMPTGSGKSLCYQLPAMELPGATLVISPLIALMAGAGFDAQAVARVRAALAGGTTMVVDFALPNPDGQGLLDEHAGERELFPRLATCCYKFRTAEDRHCNICPFHTEAERTRRLAGYLAWRSKQADA